MVKEINENWANEILKGNREMQTNNESTKAIEFIKYVHRRFGYGSVPPRRECGAE